MSDDLVLFGIMVAPLIRELVNLLKRLGVSGVWNMIAAILVAAVLVALSEIAGYYPAVEPAFRSVVTVLSAALWASTIYNVERALNGKS